MNPSSNQSEYQGSPSPAGRDTSSLLSCYGAAVLGPVWPLAPSPSSSRQPYLELYSYRVVGKTPSFKYNRVNFSSALISQAASSCQTVVCPSVATIYVATLTHSITNDPKEYIFFFFFGLVLRQNITGCLLTGFSLFVCLFAFSPRPGCFKLYLLADFSVVKFILIQLTQVVHQFLSLCNIHWPSDRMAFIFDSEGQEILEVSKRGKTSVFIIC